MLHFGFYTANFFNSIGTRYVTRFDLIPQSHLRINTKSDYVAERVCSGVIMYPDIELRDFGAAYDHTISLLNIPELQQINGKFSLPTI